MDWVVGSVKSNKSNFKFFGEFSANTLKQKHEVHGGKKVESVSAWDFYYSISYIHTVICVKDGTCLYIYSQGCAHYRNKHYNGYNSNKNGRSQGVTLHNTTANFPFERLFQRSLC